MEIPYDDPEDPGFDERLIPIEAIQEPKDTKVVDMEKAKEKLEEKKGRGRPKKDTEKPTDWEIDRNLSAYISGQPMFKRPFPEEFYSYGPGVGERQIFRKDKKKRIWVHSCEEELGAVLFKAMKNFAGPEQEFRQNFEGCKRVAKAWKYLTLKTIGQWPKPIAFASDEEIPFVRLDFDPVFGLRQFPIIEEVLSRMSDAVAFCAMIGSMYLPNASRKQILWLFGDTDAGKSFLLNYIVAKVCGGEMGTASFSGDALTGSFWKEPLIGKSLLIINEATKSFLNHPSFKSLTGDDLHMINPKGKPMFQARLDCRVFCSSNEEPGVSSAPELRNRILACRITAFKGEKKSPAILAEEVKKELSSFIGYCIELASQLEGKPIQPSEAGQADIQSAIDSHEEVFLNIFDRHFILDASAEIDAALMDSLIGSDLARIDPDYKKFKAFLSNRFKLKSKTKKPDNTPPGDKRRIRVWPGIKERHQIGLPSVGNSNGNG